MGWGDGKKVEVNGVHPAGRYAPDVEAGPARKAAPEAAHAAPDVTPAAESAATAAEVERVVEARDAYRQGYLDLQDRLAALRQELADERKARKIAANDAAAWRQRYEIVMRWNSEYLHPLLRREPEREIDGAGPAKQAAALIVRLRAELAAARAESAALARAAGFGPAHAAGPHVAPGENPATAALRRLARSLADQIGPGTEAAADVSGADVAVVTGEDALGNAGFRVSVSCDSDAASLTLANAVEDLLNQVQVYLQKDGLDQMADEIAAAKRAESARGDDKADADAPPGTPANPLRMAVGDTLHIISNGLTYRFTFREP